MHAPVPLLEIHSACLPIKTLSSPTAKVLFNFNSVIPKFLGLRNLLKDNRYYTLLFTAKDLVSSGVPSGKF